MTFSSWLEIVTSFLSYDLNVQVPLFASSLNVASSPVGTGDVTFSPFTFPVTFSGAFAFNSAGNSTPFVPLTYSYVTLCSLGVNFHAPSNVTSFPFTFASTSFVSGSWSSNPSNFQTPSFVLSSTSVGFFLSPGVAFVPFTAVFSSGSWASTAVFTSAGISFIGESSATLNSCVTLNFSGSGSGVNSHVPVTFSSWLEIVTESLSKDLNFQVPLFASSLNVASSPVGTGDVTFSPFTFPVTFSGAFAFNSAGNSTPFVPLTYSYVTLCSLGVNFHAPSNVTSFPFTFASTSFVSGSWSSNPSNFQTPSFVLSSTSVGFFLSPGVAFVPFTAVFSSGSCASTAVFTSAGISLTGESSATLNSCFTLNLSCTKCAVKVRGSVITACFNCSSVIFSPSVIFVPSFNVISLSAVQWLNLYPSFAFVSVPFGFDLSSTSSFVLGTKFSPSLTCPLPSVV